LDNDAYITYLQSIADAEYAEHNTEIQKTTSRVRSNPNPTKLINNKSTISNFYKEILEYSARYVKRSVDSFSNDGFGTLTILNTQLDYGTEGASADNFELLVYGLNIPGDYSVKEVGNNVVITLNDEYIDFDNVTLNDIYVIGKLKDIVIGTEFDTILSTENDEEIIL
jgi:hypothetical protein